MINREPIYAALFAKLQNLPGIVTASRRLKHYADVPPTQQPAIFMIQRTEAAEQVKNLPAKWRLHADVIVYVNTGEDPNGVPAQLLNPIIDAIETALDPDSINGSQTLGGLVSHCWISGSIETAEGVLGPQEIAVIPIEIMLPSQT